MAHAEKCPICDGRGSINKYGYTGAREETCHVCNGLGYVTVEGDVVASILPDYIVPTITAGAING